MHKGAHTERGAIKGGKTTNQRTPKVHKEGDGAKQEGGMAQNKRNSRGWVKPRILNNERTINNEDRITVRAI